MKNKKKLISFEALILNKFLLLLLVLPTNAESPLKNNYDLKMIAEVEINSIERLECSITDTEKEQMSQIEERIRSLLTDEEYEKFLINDFSKNCPIERLRYRQKVLEKVLNRSENKTLLLKQEERETEQNKKDSLFANVRVQVNQEFSLRQSNIRSAEFGSLNTTPPITRPTPAPHNPICHVNKNQEKQIMDLEKEIESLLTRSEFYDFVRNDFGSSCPKKRLLYRQKVLAKIKQ